MAAVYPVPDARTGDQVMAALELVPGAAFDPEAFAAVLAAAPDLGTKWAPRFVRVVAAMPLTGTNKVDKEPLRAAAGAPTTRCGGSPSGAAPTGASPPTTSRRSPPSWPPTAGPLGA